MRSTKPTKREEPVLHALSEISQPHGKYCVPFSCIARTLEREDIPEIRRITRALVRKGLAEYVRGLFNDDMQLVGSGHCITIEGLRFLGERELKQAINGELHIQQEIQ